jgi:uncharacterized membrane protein
MLNILFFGSLIVYCVSVILNFLGLGLKNKTMLRLAWMVFLAAFALHSGYFTGRGIIAGRLP